MTHPPPQNATRATGDSLLWSLVSAGLFLYVGFGMGLVGISESALYNGSVAALVWGARIVGIGLLVTTALAYIGVQAVEPLDFVLAALAAGGCFVIGVIWLAFRDGQGILLLLFGVLNASAARYAWYRWRGRAAATQAANDDLFDPP